MARDPGLKVEGLARAVRDLQAFGLDVDDLKDVFGSLASEAAAVVARYAPKGKTRRLSGDVRGNRAKSKAVVAVGRARIPYAGPVNYGWKARNIAPSMFMQKASAVMEPVALARIEAGVNRQIRKRDLK